MNEHTLARRALIVVDIQNDFVEGGSLAVAGGKRVAAQVSAYLAANAGRYELRIASRDFHDQHSTNGGHFAEAGADPDYVDTWPEHCVGGTNGAEYAEALDLTHITHHVRKGMGEPAYSAFQGILEDGHTLGELFANEQITEVDVVGIATDYCVKATALDAAATAEVRVLLPMTAAVAPDNIDQVIADLAASGIHTIGHLTR